MVTDIVKQELEVGDKVAVATWDGQRTKLIFGLIVDIDTEEGPGWERLSLKYMPGNSQPYRGSRRGRRFAKEVLKVAA